MEIADPSDEPILIVIPRAAVESCDTEDVLRGLSVLVRSTSLAPQARGKLRLEFDGFSDDRRELWQIPSVRRFVERLDAVFPYWFFLSDLRSETLLVIAGCLCRVREVTAGTIVFDKADLVRFYLRQFAGMNELWESHALPVDQNVKATQEIESYFAAREVLN